MPQNHNRRFPQYQATQAGTFEKISCQLQAGQEAAQASQANGAIGLAGLQNQNKRVFWLSIARQAFWLIWKNS
jgi:hypothetical protein